VVLREGGRHTIYRHPPKPGLVPVPRHRQLSSGVVRDIILIETLTAAMRENGDPLPAATTHTVTV